jgi:hypothetical protein
VSPVAAPNQQRVHIDPPAKYEIISMPPTTGANPSYSFILQECHRAGQQIQCSMKLKNNTDSETILYLHNASTATDDEGNQVRINFTFAGSNRSLPPDVWVNCDLGIPDTHLGAKSVTIEIRANFMDKANALDILMYKAVPVQ